MHTRFIDQFDVVLLDVSHTFMFGVDRFSDTEDYSATYRQIGGNLLSNGDVCRTITALFDSMLADYEDPNCYDSFAPVFSCLKVLPESKNLPAGEIQLLAQVFAMHEVGTIPAAYAKALHRLHETHRLGVISNIWSSNDLYLCEFERVGIRNLFDVIIFSSDYSCIKPSPYIFAKAIEVLDVDRSKIVFVGDSLKHDIAGAKAAGLLSVWINTGIDQIDESISIPELIIKDLRDLIER
ncbi:haloacid dehalogenase [Candidatus Poribacteria bacterium]|nr:MAG: haloacid dehalogenase [Candidatus Poribacteria bacterium]